MNIKERINFYNSLATSSPVIYQKIKCQTLDSVYLKE